MHLPSNVRRTRSADIQCAGDSLVHGDQAKRIFAGQFKQVTISHGVMALHECGKLGSTEVIRNQFKRQLGCSLQRIQRALCRLDIYLKAGHDRDADKSQFGDRASVKTSVQFHHPPWYHRIALEWRECPVWPSAMSAFTSRRYLTGNQIAPRARLRLSP